MFINFDFISKSSHFFSFLEVLFWTKRPGKFKTSIFSE